VIAVVTGGGSGIGKAVALALARDGWSVVVAGRREEALAGTSSEAPGGAIVAVPADVRDPSSVAELFARTESAFGRLDLLFNNAGVNGPPLPLEELPYESWAAVLETNVTGTFLCTQQAVKLMKRQEPRGGRIVNNGSLSAYVPRPGSAPYTAAKHAITGLTRSTALDGRPFDIACGQIDIGNAATEMAAGVAGTEPTIDVEAVARAVLYMASLPLDANVLFMTVMATKMPYVGRG
jgi:NAD(P)-dependent dehydrogenase (short-subunit alcohol dehydrogenase family)